VLPFKVIAGDASHPLLPSLTICFLDKFPHFNSLFVKSSTSICLLKGPAGLWYPCRSGQYNNRGQRSTNPCTCQPQCDSKHLVLGK